MQPRLSPAQRSSNASIAANTRWSQEDGRAGTQAARANGPGSLDYWARQIDPAGVLSDRERDRRAHNAKTAYYQRLAKKSAAVRRSRKGGP